MSLALNAIEFQETKQAIGLENQKRLHGKNGTSPTAYFEN